MVCPLVCVLTLFRSRLGWAGRLHPSGFSTPQPRPPVPHQTGKEGHPFLPSLPDYVPILIGKQGKPSRVFLFNLWCSSITFPVFPCWLMEWTLILTCFHQAGFYNLDPSLFAHHYTCLSIFQHFHPADPNPSWMLPSNKSSKQSESATSTHGGFFSVDSFGIN